MSIHWMRTLIETEIVAWNHIDHHLKAQHGISLAFFEVLDVLACVHPDGMRIGDIAQALRITVGAASKLIDRIEAARYVSRQADPADRRASRVLLSDTGLHLVSAARASYTHEVQRILDAALTPAEQHTFHLLAHRITTAFVDQRQSARHFAED